MGRISIGPASQLIEQKPLVVQEIAEALIDLQEPIVLTQIVEVPVEKIIEVERLVEVEKIVYVDKPVEVIRTVEKLIHVDRPVEVIKEKIIEVPVEKIVVEEYTRNVYKVPMWAYVVMAMEAAAIIASFLY
jgi:hypothetical protein